MSGHDAEIETFRRDVSCAALLERLPPPWRLDKAESTRGSLKYRRGEGEVLIVNHDGRGWWDPMSLAKGDVFNLVQHLEPGLSFGQVRRVLRPFVGLSSTYPEALRDRARRHDGLPMAGRWAGKPRISPGCPAWEYLASERGLPVTVLEAACAADVVRQGAYESAWSAHRDEAGAVSHIEIRGPDFKASVRDGRKTLFSMSGDAVPPSPGCRRSADRRPEFGGDRGHAGGHGLRCDGWRHRTRDRGGHPQRLPDVEATRAGCWSAPRTPIAGDRYAERHAEIAAAAGARFERLRPPVGEDWNDTLKGRGV